jgi:hypothetical protein
MEEYEHIERNFQSYRYELKHDLFDYELKGDAGV